MSDQVPPGAPWALRGEIVLAWVRPPRLVAMPAGIRRVPGPAALIASRYTDSPVGPFLELAVGVPARLGLRPGFCVVAQAVSVSAARLGYLRSWGSPAELANLTWDVEGETRRLTWPERDVSLSVTPIGPTIPALVPVRSLQRRSDGPVVVPRHVGCLMRIGTVTVDAGDDPLLGWTDGPHPGAVLRNARMLVRPARTPAGLLSSLRAPLAAAEPAYADGRAGPAARTPPATVATRSGM